MWAEAIDVHQVVASEDGSTFTWRVDLPEQRLTLLQKGEPLESPPFKLPSGSGARFQFFPKGDGSTKDDGACSLWLWSDSQEPVPLHLRIGETTERANGASDFGALSAALNGADFVEISLRLGEATRDTSEKAASAAAVQQSLQLDGLERAEWQVFHVKDVVARGALHTSPPFRFHHVLLGDMYLELLPEPDLCTLFFRCRVPTMKLKVSVSVGNAFSNTFESVGKSTRQADLKTGACLQINLDAPGVLEPDGSLKVHCTLDKVVSIPNSLRDMMPKLDERALWPKRL